VIAFTLVEILVVIVVIAILAGIALPLFTSTSVKGKLTQNLSNAKTVGLGLRLYAADHKGLFPASATSANAAYRFIVPNYIPTQKVFFLANSGWCTGSQPVEYGPTGTLAAGQNNYAYVSGLTDSDNVDYPLLADGFNDGAPRVYNSVKGTKGGIWSGTKAVVVRVDDSAEILPVAGSDFKVHSNGIKSGNANTDIFTTSATWMPSGTVLNPE